MIEWVIIWKVLKIVPIKNLIKYKGSLNKKIFKMDNSVSQEETVALLQKESTVCALRDLQTIFSISVQFSSVHFSRSVVSNSLRPHESHHARLPCPSPTPGVHADSRPSSQWCNPAISYSVVPFSSCSQSLPASESFPLSQLFAWGGQSIGVSALASVLPMNTQDWFPLEDVIKSCFLSLQYPEHLRGNHHCKLVKVILYISAFI